MKTICILLAISSCSIFAQVSVPSESNMQKPVPPAVNQKRDRPIDALELSAEQKAALVPIMQGVKAQVDIIRVDTSLDSAGKMKKIKAIRDAIESEIQAILTPPQRVQMQKLKDARKEQMQTR